MERPSIGPVDVRTPPSECIAVHPTSKTKHEQVVRLNQRISGEGESLDTHISFEHVEEHDIHRRKALDQRAADAVLLRGKLASE
jgi:hypothetical protein